MNKDLYNGIVDRIKLKVPEFKTVRLFNNQFDRSNNDEPRDEQAFLYPACFLEFAETEYQTQTQLLQSFTGVLRLHIGFESYKDEDIEFITLKQNLFKALQGFQVSTQKTFGRLLRLREQTDNNHNNTLVYIQEYQLSGKDIDFSSMDEQVEVAPPIALELNGNLDIDSDVIRTGDGV